MRENANQRRHPQFRASPKPLLEAIQELHVRLAEKLGHVTIHDPRHLLRLANLTLRRFLVDWARKRRPVQALEGAPPTLAERLLWIALAAFPSALLLAITNQLLQNIAPIPLLWVLPTGLPV